ncbi:hypothetical protein LSH36_7g16089 [Paralvinella palmiformis]|uniref:Exosome complex component RRP45 n=1 Tax=Paralvinella palmiformis TaxID=53620 RepID=A0AAD9KEK5_9ANNE|nr:hypothetical protein LSH36_7g16089 [Paralvinella palmiformis]
MHSAGEFCQSSTEPLALNSHRRGITDIIKHFRVSKGWINTRDCTTVPPCVWGDAVCFCREVATREGGILGWEADEARVTVSKPCAHILLLLHCHLSPLYLECHMKARLDGREIYDYRPIQIKFGISQGCCHVTLGNTRILVQVSCEVTAPKQARPSEGILFVNVEISPMAAPQYEPGRLTEEAVELTRLLERCLKESRCVDTESLCIMTGIKVWQIRCDIHILNHDGNLLDCASVAAIAALAHFRRPDVTVSGEEVTIHSLEDRDPIPLSVHHMPLCVTFAFYKQGKFLLVDPSEKEERVMEGKLVIGMNKHREVCTLQMTGSMLLLKDQVLRCSNITVKKVTEMTNLIQKALENDTKARSSGQKFGFASSIEISRLSSNQLEATNMSKESFEEKIQSIVQESSDESYTSDDNCKTEVHILGRGTGVIGEGGPSTWDVDLDEDEEMIAELENEQGQKQNRREIHSEVMKTAGSLGDESEEEQTITLQSEDFSGDRMEISAEPRTTIDLTKALKTEKKQKSLKKSKLKS